MKTTIAPLALVLLVSPASILQAQRPGEVDSNTLIGNAYRGCESMYELNCETPMWGAALAPVGDFDGDGASELVIGRPADTYFFDGDDRLIGGADIFFLDPDGTVETYRIVSPGFEPYECGSMGMDVTRVDDLDGDGLDEVAVASHGYVFCFSNSITPNVTIQYLNVDGSVRQSTTVLSGVTVNGLAWLGDVDGDGNGDLAVGLSGEVRILFLDANASVVGTTILSDGSGGLVGPIDSSFGRRLATVGDLDGDGVVDLAVGTPGDDDGGADRGAVWILFLNADGTVHSQQKISDTEGGFRGTLGDGAAFGTGLTTVPLDQDGSPELVVGAPETAPATGKLFVLRLAPDGTVLGHVEYAAPSSDHRSFGHDVAFLGDQDGNGLLELAVGAPRSDLPNLLNNGGIEILTLAEPTRATAVIRNGGGTNIDGFRETQPAVLGSTWEGELTSLPAGTVVTVVTIGFGGPISGIHLNGFFQGELLILPPVNGTQQGPGTHSIPVPNLYGLAGAPINLQAGAFVPGNGIQLFNALDLTLGY